MGKPTPEEPATDARGAASRDLRSGALRIVVAIAAALAFALGVYALLQATRPASGLVSFSFLLILPAAISAFVAYVADPWGERRLSSYLMAPVWILLAVVVASVFLLKEGAVCVILLSPLWLASGLAGAGLTYRLRRRLERGRLYCSAVLIAPLLAIALEPTVPLRWSGDTVSRTVVVEAGPERIWPLLRGIPDVRPGEGRWNVSQDLVGIPRPRGARLVGEGIGADRLAYWGQDIRFHERITEWQVERRIAWRFIFDDLSAWDFTDRHLKPDSPYFRVTEGGYRLEPIGPDRTRVVLETSYRMRTPVNAYSALWGELFLGDLESNLLAVIKQRAEG